MSYRAQRHPHMAIVVSKRILMVFALHMRRACSINTSPMLLETQRRFRLKILECAEP